MKALLALFACALVSVALSACGASPRAAQRTTGSGAQAAGKLDRDDDHDNNDDDYYVLGFGHVAGPADDRAIRRLVKEYFAAAATENGAKACSLLTPFVAETVVEEESHSPAVRGRTCAVVMSKLFKFSHRELVGKNANLKVIRVGVEGDVARVGLSFPEIPVIRQIRIRRQGTRWTVLDLLDNLIE